MGKEEIRQKLIRILAEECDVEADSIRPETDTADLKLGSLQFILLINRIEDVFDITIPDEKFGEIQSVADMEELVDSMLNG